MKYGAYLEFHESCMDFSKKYSTVSGNFARLKTLKNFIKFIRPNMKLIWL